MNSTLIQTDRFALSETERSAIEHEMHHSQPNWNLLRASSIDQERLVAIKIPFSIPPIICAID